MKNGKCNIHIGRHNSLNHNLGLILLFAASASLILGGCKGGTSLKKDSSGIANVITASNEPMNNTCRVPHQRLGFLRRIKFLDLLKFLDQRHSSWTYVAVERIVYSKLQRTFLFSVVLMTLFLLKQELCVICLS